jgi:hypothetical protein
MGLMTHVPIHESEAGAISATAATSSTITPIQRAMKSHIILSIPNCFSIALFFSPCKSIISFDYLKDFFMNNSKIFINDVPLQANYSAKGQPSGSRRGTDQRKVYALWL